MGMNGTGLCRQTILLLLPADVSVRFSSVVIASCQRISNVAQKHSYLSSLFHFVLSLPLTFPSNSSSPPTSQTFHLQIILFLSLSPSFSLPYFPLTPSPSGPPHSLFFLFLSLFLFFFFFGPLFVPLYYALSCSHHTFFSPSHLSIRSWKSVSAIITMQSCSL